MSAPGAWKSLFDQPHEGKGSWSLNDKGPIIGFRFWNLREGRGKRDPKKVVGWKWLERSQSGLYHPPVFECTLHSIGAGGAFVWKKGELEATCANYDHKHQSQGLKVDLKNCTCGFYARTSLFSIVRYAQFSIRRMRMDQVFGAIMMYGEVEYGQNVIRSEKCQILCFILPFSKEKKLSESPTHRCFLPSQQIPSGCPDFVGFFQVKKGRLTMECPTCEGTRVAPITGDDVTPVFPEQEAYVTKMQKVADSFKVPLVYQDNHRAYLGEYGEILDGP